MGNLEGKRSIGRPKRRWEDTIKMDLQEVGWGIEWIWLMIRTGGGFVQGNEVPHSIKSGEFLEQLRICWLLKQDSAPQG